MSIFDIFMTDIFSNKDFLESCIIEGKQHDCIVSNITGGITYTDAGQQSEVSFTLDIKLPIARMPETNDKVIFRGETYKVSYIEIDSASTSIKIYLVAQSKGV